MYSYFAHSIRYVFFSFGVCVKAVSTVMLSDVFRPLLLYSLKHVMMIYTMEIPFFMSHIQSKYIEAIG